MAARINSGVCDAPLPLKKHAWPVSLWRRTLHCMGQAGRQAGARRFGEAPHAVRAEDRRTTTPFGLGYCVPVKDTAATEKNATGYSWTQKFSSVQTVTAYVYLQFRIALGGWVAKDILHQDRTTMQGDMHAFQASFRPLAIDGLWSLVASPIRPASGLA